MQWLLDLLLLFWPTVQQEAGKNDHVAEDDDNALHDSCLTMKDCIHKIDWSHTTNLPSQEAKDTLKEVLSAIGLDPAGVTNVKMQKKTIMHKKFGEMKLYKAQFKRYSKLCQFEFGHCVKKTCPRQKPSTHPVCKPLPPEQKRKSTTRKPTTSKPKRATLRPKQERKATTKKPTTSEPEQATPCPECDAIP